MEAFPRKEKAGKVGFVVLVTSPRPRSLRPQASPAAAVGWADPRSRAACWPWEVEVWPPVYGCTDRCEDRHTEDWLRAVVIPELWRPVASRIKM